MAVRSLYLRIYLTVVAVLLVFALVAGMMVRQHAESEYQRIEGAVQSRTQALAELLSHSLPPAEADAEVQAAAVLDWSQRLRLAVALESADGARIVQSPDFQRLEAEGRLSPDLGNDAAAEVAAPGQRADASRPGAERYSPRTVRLVMDDRRVLIVANLRVRPRPSGRDFGGPDRSGPPPDRLPHSHEPGRERGNDAGGNPRGHDHAGPGPGVDSGRRFRPDAARADEWWLAGIPASLRRWVDEGTLLLVPLAVLFVAIALGSYPVVRRLTRRLEQLKHGVEVFGSGQLSHRVTAQGDDEVAAVATSFNQAAERIEQLVRANRSLLANASHELRSPLARLKMAVTMMELGDSERRRALRQEIDRDILELDVLVEEVLLASRLDADAGIGHEPVDLIGLAAEEAARVGAQLASQASEAELALRGDERLLRRALRNLLENARRYGGDDVMVELRLKRGSTVPGAVTAPVIEMAVCDRGPGVPPDQRERIFEPFYRLPGHSERAGGVGLGLSLVRQIAQRHGGSVRCESRKGGGSQFVLTLPTGT